MLHSPEAGKQRKVVKQALSSPREVLLQAGHRVWAEIDLDYLTANTRNLKQRAGEALLLAVIKANAYGHGAIGVAAPLLEAGAWGLGVISLEEGEELRRAGITAPVLVLGSSSPVMAPRLVAADLRTTVASRELAWALSGAAQAQGKQAVIHLKVETGLNRAGMLPPAVTELAEELRKTPDLLIEGIATHLASVDEGDRGFTNQQFETFAACARELSWIPIHHVSSTGALLDLPEMSLAMVRTGIGIYGCYPSDEVSRSVALTPVMSLRSRVARVATIEPGESVGYGRTWVARRRSRIATVMAGYGDGIRRQLSGRGVALVRGQRAPYVGRIAMDMLMVDVSGIDGVAAEDEVTLLGGQGNERVSAEELASSAGTINYEILTGIMARVPRFYVKNGQITASHELSGYRILTAP